MTLSEKLRALLALKGLNQTKLAEICSVKPAAVSGWMAGGGVKRENLEKIAAWFDVPLDWLEYGIGEPPKGLIDFLSLGAKVPVYVPDEDRPPPGFSIVKEYEIVFSAGTGSEQSWQPIDNPESELWVRDEVFRRHHTRPENCKAVRVLGSSMEPTLSDGDRVVCVIPNDPSPNIASLRDGAIYALTVDGVLRIKRLVKIKDGYRLISDNPQYEPEEFVKDDANRILIYGQVIYAEREF